MNTSRIIAATILVLAVLAGACSSSDDAGSATAPSTTYATTAVSADRTLVVALVAPPDQLDALIETVFQPAVAGLQEEPHDHADHES